MATSVDNAGGDQVCEIRLFIAITLPSKLKNAIQQLQNELRLRLPEQGFRWTKQEQFHLTLVFLGNVPETAVLALSAALERACRAFPPLLLRVEGVGVFPTPSSPRVLWVGIKNATDQLGPLQQSIQSEVAAFSREELKDRFKAHVTLARVKEVKRSEIGELRELIGALRDRCLGEWLASEVELIRSQLSPKGSTYTTLYSARLRSEPVT